MQLDRMENESKLEHHRRLVYGKLVDKTLADVDYTELSKFVYGKDLSSDVARREMYGSRYTLELMAAERVDNCADSDMVDELNDKIIELQKQAQVTRDQAREYRKMMNSDGRWEHLAEELLVAAKNLPETVGSLFTTDTQRYISSGEDEAIVVFSDWHYGMVTNNVFNTYNTDICRYRIQKVINEAKKRISLHGCNKIHVVFLGDAIHGAIKTGVRVASEELVVDQLLQSSELLAQAILELYTCVPNIEVHCTYGNHARVTENKADNVHRDNWERIIPSWLTQRIGAECFQRGEALNISIAPDTGTEFLFINACGHDILAVHGDLDRPRSATQVLPLLLSKHNMDVEFIILGDQHHRESFASINATARICGSLCGTDDYANTKRLYSPPSQLLLIVNPECGVDAEYEIKV